MVRLKYLDSFKVILAFMVVGLHLEVFGGSKSLLGYVLVDGLFRIAVPFFFIVNGYFLKGALDSGRPFKSWVGRIVLLYICWAVIYFPFYAPVQLGGDVSLANSAVSILFGYWHLWYLVATLVAGGLLFKFGLFEKKWCAHFSFSLYVVGWGLQVLRAYGLNDIEGGVKYLSYSWVARNGVFFGVPFFYIGALIRKYEFLIFNVSSRMLAVGVLVGVALLFGESVLNFNSQGDKKVHFDILMSLLVLCPFLFLLVIKNRSVGGWDGLGKFSSSLYLVHPLVILMLSRWVGKDGWHFVFLTCLASVALALCVVKISKKLPWIA